MTHPALRLLDSARVPSACLRLARSSVTVVLYHGVDNHQVGQGIYNYRGKFITPEAFRAQLLWMREHYRILPLSELTAPALDYTNGPSCVITFDDGYENLYTHAYPILKDLQVPATVFLSTDPTEHHSPLWMDRLEYAIGHSRSSALPLQIDGQTTSFPTGTLDDKRRTDRTLRDAIKKVPDDQRAAFMEQIVSRTGADLRDCFLNSPYRGLSWRQVEEMAAGGIAFGSHTKSHRILSQLKTEEAEREVLEAHELLRAHVENPVNVFAYPNGQSDDYDKSTLEILRRSGFVAAVTTRPGILRGRFDPFQIPRFTLDRTDDPVFFRLTVTGVLDTLRRMRSTFRPNKVSPKRFFDDTADAYLAEYERETPEGHSFRERKQKTLELLGTTTGKRILDIGSGPGILTRELLEGGASVVASDVAPEMIRLVRTRFQHPNLEARVENVNQLTFADSTFDVVIALGLLEYLNPDQTALAEIHRVLKNQGEALVSVPNYWAPWRIWNRLLVRLFRIPWAVLKKVIGRSRQVVDHNEYTQRSIRELGRSVNLQTLDILGYNAKLVLYPLDKLFPKITVRATAPLSGLGRSPLKFLSTGYIVRFRKP